MVTTHASIAVVIFYQDDQRILIFELNASIFYSYGDLEATKRQ